MGLDDPPVVVILLIKASDFLLIRGTLMRVINVMRVKVMVCYYVFKSNTREVSNNRKLWIFLEEHGRYLFIIHINEPEIIIIVLIKACHFLLLGTLWKHCRMRV